VRRDEIEHLLLPSREHGGTLGEEWAKYKVRSSGLSHPVWARTLRATLIEEGDGDAIDDDWIDAGLVARGRAGRTRQPGTADRPLLRRDPDVRADDAALVLQHPGPIPSGRPSRLPVGRGTAAAARGGVMAVALEAPAVVRVEQRLAREQGAMPVADVVSRSLGAQSWMLVVRSDGRLRAISILGARDAASPAARIDAPPADSGVVAADGRIRVAPESVVALRIRATRATPQQLLDLALRDADPVVRADAARAGLRAMAADRTLERSVEGMLDGFTDAALARLAATAVGDGAADLLAVVAAEARDRPIGRRARAVLDLVH
jgi:hypothetical protein